MNHCADAIDAKRYVLPDEEHMMYRVIPQLFFLLDGDDRQNKNALNAFKVRTGRSAELCARHPPSVLYTNRFLLWPIVPFISNRQCI